MRSTPTRNSALCAVLLIAGVAHGHPKGFHARVALTVSKTTVTALVTMDVDAGRDCLLLREAADADRNGALTGDEVTALKEQLVKLATASIKVTASGAPVLLEVVERKLSLREDRRAGDGPLSVAVLLEYHHRDSIRSGMTLEVVGRSPDASPVALEVFVEGSEKPLLQTQLVGDAPARVTLPPEPKEP